MKRIFTILLVTGLTLCFTSCQKNMQRDVKRLAHKTEQCFSLADPNSIDNSDNKEFNKCYGKLEKLMNKLDKKYASEEESLEFGRLYLEELQGSDLPDDFKELCTYLYSLGTDEMTFGDVANAMDDDLADEAIEEEEHIEE